MCEHPHRVSIQVRRDGASVSSLVFCPVCGVLATDGLRWVFDGLADDCLLSLPEGSVVVQIRREGARDA